VAATAARLPGAAAPGLRRSPARQGSAGSGAAGGAADAPSDSGGPTPLDPRPAELWLTGGRGRLYDRPDRPMIQSEASFTCQWGCQREAAGLPNGDGRVVALRRTRGAGDGACSRLSWR